MIGGCGMRLTLTLFLFGRVTFTLLNLHSADVPFGTLKNTRGEYFGFWKIPNRLALIVWHRPHSVMNSDK